VRDALADDVTELAGQRFTLLLGPRHRMLIIGAGDIARYLAPIALALGYRVEVCDPRPEHAHGWSVAGIEPVRAMPDDYLLLHPPGSRCAVVTTSHDPKIDDLALIEALRSRAFYVGALGSLRTTVARKRRLAEHFGLSATELDRLHGPVGLDIGSRTPAEIAVSIAAEIVQVQRAAETAARRQAPAPDRLAR
jgi:xanthine dehydrogenase accessory factor